jgi:hypothetical protein
MKSEQFHSFELQEYFCFGKMQKFIYVLYKDCLNHEIFSSTLSDMNLDICLNKDGQFAATLFYSIRSVII